MAIDEYLFLRSCKTTSYFHVEKYGDYLFTMSEKVNTKLLNVIRYGVKVGEVTKDEIRYDVALVKLLLMIR